MLSEVNKLASFIRTPKANAVKKKKKLHKNKWLQKKWQLIIFGQSVNVEHSEN